MSAPTIVPSPRLGLLRALLLALVGMSLVVVGCGSGGPSGGDTAATLLHYQRVWPDGTTEQQTVFGDGRVEMRHGEVLERLTITPENVERLRAALAADIPTGSADDSPKRTLTLSDGTVIDAPRPDQGTVTELLDRLLDTHRLG